MARECDRQEINMNEGVKHDGGKLPVGLIPPEALLAEAACAAMRVALESVPFRAYGEALESGCDAEGAWNSCREECDEHIVRALSSGAGSHLLEWAQQVARYLESQKVINEGRPDYCCAAQEGFVTRARDLGLLERQHDE
jgi:hypothetical protein